ncbi:MAG: oxygenase MpaB family protein [Acidobacteriota bacterium]
MPSLLVSELPQSPVPVTRWSGAFLDRMRLVADPETDALALEVFQLGGPKALIRMTQLLEDWEAPIPQELPLRMRDWFARPVEYPAFVDPARLRIAEELFVAYGPVSTVALLMCALPHFFTNPAGARSFYLAKIFSPDSLRNRMLEMTQFVASITQYGGLAQFWVAPAQRRPDEAVHGVRKGGGMMTVQKLRVIHSGIRILLSLPREPERRWDTATLGEPINQEDMCEAILCFVFCTIDSLEKLGIVQSPAEQEATLCAWKTVAHLLGMPEELQPATVAEGRALHKQLFERSCKSTDESRVLIGETLHIMRCMMPRGLKRVPQALMRYLLGPRVANQMAVPDNRVLLRTLGATHWLWGERLVFARLARLTCPWIVQWMASCEAARTHPILPDTLSNTFGSQRV